MANDNPGSPTSADSRAAETTFSPRPDDPYARPAADAGRDPSGWSESAPDRSSSRPRSGSPPYGGQQGSQYGTGQYGSAGQRATGQFAAAGPPPAYGSPGQAGTAEYRTGSGGPPSWGTGQQPAVGWGPPSPGTGAGYGATGYGGAAPAASPSTKRERRGPGWGALAAVGIVAALLGGVGGAFGANLTDGSGGSSGVLAAPVPDVGGAAAPVGPVEAVAERVLPSVVQLRVEGPSAAGEGSGIVLSADGLILTNNHVVEAGANGGRVTAVFQDGRSAPAEIVGLDPTSDLAVIRAQGVTDLVAAELGNSDAVRVGQPVVAFGSPLGLGGTVTSGIISAVDRAVSVGEESGASEATVLSALQTDAAINPGNSGGPLTDMEGRIIGINSVIATTGEQGGSIGVGFAIPVNQARRIAEELEATGTATRAVLGVRLRPDDPRSLAGATVEAVDPGGAAELAGIRPGDVIVRYGDVRVTNAIELQAAVRSSPPGEVVEVELVDRTLQVTPTAVSN